MTVRTVFTYLGATGSAQSGFWTLDGDGLGWSQTAGGWRSGYVEQGVMSHTGSGKWAFEMTAGEAWSTHGAAIGLFTGSSVDLNVQIGTKALQTDFAISQEGEKEAGGSSSGTDTDLDWQADGETIMIILDLDAGEISAISDGGSGTEKTCFTGLNTSLEYMPCFSSYATSGTNDPQVNFGSSAFVNTLPAGVLPWNNDDAAEFTTVLTGGDSNKNSDITIDGDGLGFSKTQNDWSSGYLASYLYNRGSGGKFAFEFTVDESYNATTGSIMLGFSHDYTADRDINTYHLIKANSYGLTQNGQKGNANTFTPVANSAFDTAGDTVMMLLDIDNGKISSISSAHATEVTLYTGLTQPIGLGQWQIMYSAWGNGGTFNFGDGGAFVNALPAGYSPWNGGETLPAKSTRRKNRRLYAF